MFQVCGDVWSAMTQIHCHCYVSGLWRCVISHDTNTLSLLCFRSVEMCDQPWHNVIVMFQVCGDAWSAMTQIHCHCYVSGLWRCVISHDTNTLSLLCFRSVEMCDQPWHKYTVIVMWRCRTSCDTNTLSLLCFRSVEVYGQLSSDSFNVEALFQSIGKFVGVFAGAFAIGSLFGIATAFVSFSWYFPHHCLMGECSWLL